MKKIIISVSAFIAFVSSLTLFSAFEAHVVNITARIENALTVSLQSIDFGTVFPQEHLNKSFEVRLSQSFLDEDRVNDVNYFIRQKPKCGITSQNGEVLDHASTATGHVSISPVDEVIIDCGLTPRELTQGETWGVLPSLCEYISKEPDGNPQPSNDGVLPAFHQPYTFFEQQLVWNDTQGRLAKSEQDFADDWTIDLAVPCFGGHCAQDWTDFVHGINSDADPAQYTQSITNEHKVFGCDLWLEVNAILELEEQARGIVQDNFNGYSEGSLLGQDGWTNYANGGNYTVQDLTVHEGSKAVFVNAIADNVITKNGASLSDGLQTFYVRSTNRASWGPYADGNAQVRISKGQSFASSIFAAVSFKNDGNVAYYDPIGDVYTNFATYTDNDWTLLEIEWRSSDKTARYRVNNGVWTSWLTFKNAGLFTDFDNLGLDFFLPSGLGAMYFDTLY